MNDFPTDYTRLAGAELDAAGIAADSSGRDYHLNRAAVFAYLGDSQDQGLGKQLDITAIGEVLVHAMALADAAEASMVAIHLDAALVALEHYSSRSAL